MLARSSESYFCPSVRPSVCHMHALRKNQTMHRGYFDTKWKGNHSSFLTLTVFDGRRPLPCEIRAQSDPAHFEKQQQQISAYNISTIRDGKKVQLRQIGSRSRAFQRATDWVHMLPLSTPHSDSMFCFFKADRGKPYQRLSHT